jgi:dynein heavy chain
MKEKRIGPSKLLSTLYSFQQLELPGAGRTFITPLLLRHLNLISIAELDHDDTLARIFRHILRIFF